MKENKNNLIYYWTILINPIVLLIFYKCIKTLSALCMYGGLRRRAPIIVGCGVLLLVWFVIWTIIYRKRKSQEQKKLSKYIWILVLCVEVILLVTTTGYYGKQIVESASPFSGRLSDKIREWTDSRKVKLKHNNIYEDGIQGIFEDLETKIDLPEELYLVNQFSVDFLEDGTITGIYSFFYGKDTKGKTRSYLLSYDSRQSEKMTVWLDGNRGAKYEESSQTEYLDEKMDSLFEMMEHINLQETIEEYDKENMASSYYLKYFGYSDIYTNEKMTVLNNDGSALPLDVVKSEKGIYQGYEISVYTADKELVARYMDGSRRIVAREEEVEEEVVYEVGKSTEEDGIVYYFLNETRGWRLVVVDAAAGSRWYRIETTFDGGKNWIRTEPDPFPEELFGVADSIWFLNEENGFVLMGGASETHSELYHTMNGGLSFSRVNLPTELVEVEIPDLAEYDYVTMPYMEGNVLKTSLSLEKYDCCRIYFESEDLGETWYYTGVSEEYDVMYKR